MSLRKLGERFHDTIEYAYQLSIMIYRDSCYNTRSVNEECKKEMLSMLRLRDEDEIAEGVYDFHGVYLIIPLEMDKKYDDVVDEMDKAGFTRGIGFMFDGVYLTRSFRNDKKKFLRYNI